MVTVLECLFWIASFVVVYPYVGYPLILAASNRFFPTKSDWANGLTNNVELHSADEMPSVTLIVSAFNEAAVIREKIVNAQSLDYPVDLLEVIVVSDGSTDGTDEIVEEYVANDSRIRLLRLESQSGKSAGLNQAVPLATGEIVVFSDANAMYEYDALLRLVEPFSEGKVGYTVGSALYQEDATEAVNDSEGLYWKYELWIKRLESAFFSVVGGDGAIYAIRRELFQPLDPIDISDFVNPIQIVAAGYRGVFLSGARSYEGGTEEFSDEFRRKRRIVNRSWGAVRRHIGLFSIKRHPRFLFMLISHKVIRWWSVAFVVLALVAGLVLALQPESGLYQLLTFGIAGSVLLALVGWRLEKLGQAMPRFVYLPYYFYLVGIASLMGIADNFKGRSYATWTHHR